MHKDGQIDACISAGNTGAFVAAAQMHFAGCRAFTGRESRSSPRRSTARWPCATSAPTWIAARSTFTSTVMAQAYLKTIMKTANPRVGLLSVGEEEAKGNELVKRTRELMKGDPNINFIGNVEGRDLFAGTCDVMVCDGFVGNVIIKVMEGMASGALRSMFAEIAKAVGSEHARQARQAAEAVVVRYDYNEYGGAPLLGVDGICIICHGSSSHRGIMNAVRVARAFSKQQLNEQIIGLLRAGQR